MLVINADDWGRDSRTTNRILDCVKCGAVSAVSAMVFMEDSERAAIIARDANIAAGLHLNFTTGFTGSSPAAALVDHHARVSRYLLQSSFAAVMFHPGLSNSFEYLVRTQCDEFAKLYGKMPDRFDGHHHMHLCANVLLQNLLPSGAMVRRSFSFRPGEKPVWNRAWRRLIDAKLKRRHCVADFFFSIAPLEPRQRLEAIFTLAADSFVELETHPVAPDEHEYLTSGEIFRACPRSTIVRDAIAQGWTSILKYL